MCALLFEVEHDTIFYFQTQNPLAASLLLSVVLEMHDVTVLDDVLSTFHAQTPSGTARCFTATI